MDQTLFEKYTKTYGRRFTRRQKHAFEQALCEDMRKGGYENTRIVGKHMGFFKAEDFFFGNMKRMKTVIVVPYDTPERKFWWNVLYYPLDGRKSTNKNLIATYTPLLAMYLLIVGFLFVAGKYLENGFAEIFATLLMILLITVLLYLLIHGASNKHNVNRNSSAVVVAISLAQSLDKDERSRVAFLFTDKNKTSYLGARFADEEFAKQGKNPNVICLDCIGKGDVTRIGYNPNNRRLAMDVEKYYRGVKHSIDSVKMDEGMRVQTPMSYFRKAITICSGDLDKDGQLVVKNTMTSKDRSADIAHLDMMIEMLKSYIKTVN